MSNEIITTTQIDNTEVIITLQNTTLEINTSIIGAGPRGEEGKSAYDLWIEDGNTGTFEEYILSLKGEKGETGNIENLEGFHIEEALGYAPADKTKEHEHINMPVIDDLADDGEGTLLYKNQKIQADLGFPTEDLVARAKTPTQIVPDAIFLGDTTQIETDINNLQNNKLDKTGDSKDNTVTFTEAEIEEDITTGEKHSTILGKILKSIKSFRTLITNLNTEVTTHKAKNVHIGTNEYVRVSRVTHQTIPNNVATKLSFDNQLDDLFDMYEPNNPTKIIIPTSGIYSVTVNARWRASSTGLRRIRILVNDNPRLQDDRLPTASTTDVTLSGLIRLLQNDILEVDVLQNSGSALDVQEITSYTSFLTLVRVSR